MAFIQPDTVYVCSDGKDPTNTSHVFESICPVNDFTFLLCATTLRAERIGISPSKMWVSRAPSVCHSQTVLVVTFPSPQHSDTDFLRCMTKHCYREHEDKNCVTTIAICCTFPVCPSAVPGAFFILHYPSSLVRRTSLATLLVCGRQRFFPG